jgi:DNA polymerase I-like protein with 3'-5' exonuclease and polymerase domains
LIKRPPRTTRKFRTNNKDFSLVSDWRAPTELPDLRRADRIALDTETKDDRLNAGMGSGWPFRQGYICGVSIAWRDDSGVQGRYFPIRHPETQNFSPEQVYQWTRDHIAAGVSFVTQNGLYDWGWLRAEAGIRMPSGERLAEIGALATLVDENRRSYNLESLCAWRGLPGKDKALLQQGIADLGLHTAKRRKLVPQRHIWQLPARYVGPYAEADAINTLFLCEDLNPILDREGTRDAYRLECDLLPMVLAMRQRGIRVDIGAAESARDLLFRKRDAVFAELSEKLGKFVGMHEIGSPKWLTSTFDSLHIKYPRTEKGNPSFSGGPTGWMRRHQHWLPRHIVEAKRYHKAADGFVQKSILDHVVNGRVHAEIHPHRSEDNGTKSFRFSYSDPPMQQMPSRDKEITPLIRGVFLPEEGEVWAKPDASQQEFRLLVHYAHFHQLPKAADAVARYCDNPDTDFHRFTAEMTGLDRDAAKAVNFAKMYGAAVRKFAEMVGKGLEEAQLLYVRYDREMPFQRGLSDLYTARARRDGYITLYDGARRHFDKYAPRGFDWRGCEPCGVEEARRRVRDPGHSWYQHPLQLVGDHTVLNALIQGSAARHTKLWMRAVWREGITPLLQMHDCLDCSVSSLEQAELVARLGCEAIRLDVPMRVDLKFGRTWADARHSWAELQGQSAPAAKRINIAGPADAATPIEAFPNQPTKKDTDIEIERADVELDVTAPGIKTPEPATRTQGSEWPLLIDVIGEPLFKGKILCPFHDDHSPSLHIYDDHFYCFVCGARGDAIDWLRERKGLSFAEEVEQLTTWSGPISNPQERTNDDAQKLVCAAQIWDQAQSIYNTLAIPYLADVRKIDINALPSDTDAVLRFHPRCPFGHGITHPCLVALYRDVETDVFAGIHRIALTPKTWLGASR